MRVAAARGENPIPASVPTQTETAWNDPRFMPPLRTFFTVDTATTIARHRQRARWRQAGSMSTPRRAIPGWKQLAAGPEPDPRRGLPAAAGADGRSVTGPPIELFQTANRYRDIALNPDGRTIYLVTDASGPSRRRGGRGHVRRSPTPGASSSSNHYGQLVTSDAPRLPASAS